MTDRILPDPAVRRLAAELTSLRREVDTLKAASRTTQLDRATLHGGRLLIRDDAGAVRGWLGKQPDGTFGLGAANGEPPSRPNTLTLSPFPAGVALGWNGELLSELPGDFSHLLLYLSPAGADFIRDESNLVGTLLRAGELPVPLPGQNGPFWAVAVAVNTSGVESEPSLVAGPVSPGQVIADGARAGIIDTLALADAAVTEAKHAAGSVTETIIADDAVTSSKIIAKAVQAIHVAADAITAGTVAADAITAREIAALSILAEHLRANIIDASHIQAGVVEAVHLAAQIILTSRIILGDPLAARMEIDEFGIAQYSDMGDPTLKLGQDPRGGNYLTVVDPLDPQRALASISDEGVMTASGFAVTGDLSYNGDELSTLLASAPRGLQGWGFATGNSPTTTNGVGWFEFEFLADPGRMYKIHTSPMVMKGTGGVVFIRYTLNGTAPTTSSPYLTYAAVNNNDTFTMTALARNDTASTARFRALLHVGSFTGNSIFIEDTNGTGHHQIWAEDIGANRDPTSTTSSGGGGTAPAPRQQTVQWDATWHGTWRPELRSGLADMVQGPYDGDVNYCAFGFDVTNIRSTLSGATIDKTELYMYVNHTYYSSGGFARIRTHKGSPNGVYPAVSGVRWVEKFGKPEGRWLDVGTAVGVEFRDALTNGFACDARDVAPSLNDYIRINGSGQSLRPKVKITFTK